MTFPERLKQLKTENHTTQKEIANAAKISDRAYRSLESGASVPNMNTLILLADYYQVSLHYLTGRTDDPTYKPVKH